MDDSFRALAASGALPAAAALELRDRGFVVVPGPSPGPALARLIGAYDAVMESATPEDLRVGSTTTRLANLASRGPGFDGLYVFAPLLDACCRVIGQPFKLSSLTARTLRPRTPAQEFHVDVPRHSDDWPLLGFIVMIDDFRSDNGATRFIPGSHHWLNAPADALSNPWASHDGEVLACGDAGSLLIFDGSVWHGHTPNASGTPRRSIQGAFIPRTGKAATDFASWMSPTMVGRLTPLARYLLAL